MVVGSGDGRIGRPHYARRPAGAARAGERISLRAVARKKLPPIEPEQARTIGALLRGLRRAAGFRAVQDAVADPACPAARQTIYAYERGGLVPSLAQFLELVEFYALEATPGPGAKPPEDLRTQAVAAVVTALTMPCYHMTEAMRLIGRLQVPPPPRRQRRARS